MSLRSRLLTGVVVLVFTGLVIADTATYLALNGFLRDRIDAELRSGAPGSAGLVLDTHAGGPGPDRGRGGPPPTDLPSGTYIAAFTPDGKLIKDLTIHSTSGLTTTDKPTLPAKLPNAGPDKPTLLDAGSPGGVRYRVLVESLDRYSGSLLVVAVPLTDVQSTLGQLLTLEALIGLGVLVAIGGLALWIVRAGLRPLDRIAETAGAIAAGDLSRRVSPATPGTEIGRLGLALNTMLAQIEAAFAERTRSENRLRRFVADASHELRTPLTSIRGYAELMRRRPNLKSGDVVTAVRRIEDESVRMTALVDDLLLLARLDQGRPLEQEPVDLRAIVQDAGADATVTAPERTVTIDAPEPVMVRGDDLRLRQAVGNLVRNAVVHTPPSTPIELSLARQNGQARLTVVDHGSGLSEEDRKRVFEPFFRADPGRSRDQGGAGLGLSIVRAVVGAHGGQVEALETEGGGATFQIDLPTLQSG